MGTLIKKENMTVVIGTYKNSQGQDKKKYRTIGELITMQGDDGSLYQFGEIWGPHGVTKINIYAQEDKTEQAPQQQGQPQQQQAPQQYAPQQQGQPQQQGYQQPPNPTY